MDHTARVPSTAATAERKTWDEMQDKQADLARIHRLWGAWRATSPNRMPHQTASVQSDDGAGVSPRVATTAPSHATVGAASSVPFVVFSTSRVAFGVALKSSHGIGIRGSSNAKLPRIATCSSLTPGSTCSGRENGSAERRFNCWLWALVRLPVGVYFLAHAASCRRLRRSAAERKGTAKRQDCDFSRRRQGQAFA
jgi:hypothetical protein